MHIFTFKNSTRGSTKPLLAALAGFFTFAAIAVAGAVTTPKVDAGVCDTTNIIRCGLNGSTQSDFVSSFKSFYTKNDDGAGHRDLQSVFNWSGFSSSLVDGMTTGNAKLGYVYRNGDVKVNGELVGTGAVVTTRLSGSGRTLILPGVYSRPASMNYTEAQSVIVLFDAKGQAISGVMTICGNSIKFTPVKRALSCTDLNAKATSNLREYLLSASAAPTNMSITGYTFSFGDGSAAKTVATSSRAASVTHVYPAYNTTYTAKVTVTAKSSFGTTSATCMEQLTTPRPSVMIDKKVDGQETKLVEVGANFVYQVTVTNNGNMTLSNVAVKDTPQAGSGIQLLSVKDGLGSISSNVWTYTVPSLKASESKTFYLTAKVTAYKAGSLVNTACVNAAEVITGGSATAQDDCDDATVTVVKPKVPHVSIVKVVNEQETASVNAGEAFTYKLTVTNDGELPLASAVVSDVQPNGVTFVSADKGVIAAGKWMYTIPSLGLGQSATFKITAKANAYTPSAIPNTACVNAAEVITGGSATAQDDCDDASITVRKPVYTCDGLTLTSGQNRTVTASFSYTAKDGATYKNTTLMWGDNKQDTVTGTSASHQYVSDGTYTVTAKMLFTVNGVDAAPAQNPNCTKQITFKTLVPGVGITKHVDGQKQKEVAVGQVFTYKVVVTNTGQTPLTKVVVSDPAPAGVTMLTTDKGSISGNALVYTIPSMAVGQSVTVNITAKVASYVAGSIVNQACVNAPEVKPENPSAQDACDAATVVVTKPKQPSVNITKTVNGAKSDVVQANESFTYELKVTNDGDVNLTNVVVTDVPDGKVTLVSADKGTIADNTWSYTIPQLGVGQSASFTLTAKVAEYVSGTLNNEACVNAPEVKPENPSVQDDCDSATVRLTPPEQKNPNISITKYVNVQDKTAKLIVGQAFTYRLIVKNTGEVVLTNAVVTDTAPNGIALLSADKGTISGNTWTYTVPNLAVGEEVTVVLNAKVTSYVAGTLVNRACVNAPELNPENPNETDACDTADVTVTPPVIAPQVLPNTGVGNIVSLFGIVTVLGALSHRLFLSRKFTTEEA